MTFNYDLALSGAREIFDRIISEYWHSRYLRRLEQNEYPAEEVCGNCKGCGTFKNEDGEMKDCYQDKVEGECFKELFDLEQFGIEVETLLPKIGEFMVLTEPHLTTAPEGDKK